MSVGSKHRGHKMILTGGVWNYCDTGKPVKEDSDRPCGHCNLPNTPEGHDPCLGTLPGVENACCGHGNRKESFIKFTNGFMVRGFETDWTGVKP